MSRTDNAFDAVGMRCNVRYWHSMLRYPRASDVVRAGKDGAAGKEAVGRLSLDAGTTLFLFSPSHVILLASYHIPATDTVHRLASHPYLPTSLLSTPPMCIPCYASPIPLRASLLSHPCYLLTICCYSSTPHTRCPGLTQRAGQRGGVESTTTEGKCPRSDAIRSRALSPTCLRPS
eukprot:3046573-Rhodomonas_salina.2